jgi:glycine cleavage system regulatory protein
MDNPNTPQLTGVRKRQQIQTTNKNIFIWLAVSSVIVSFCIVALQFLVKEFLFNQKIISAKSETNQRLQANIDAAAELTKNVQALLADENLSVLKTADPDPKNTPLSVVLDALPVEGDSTGFANSLQTAVFPRSGISIRELSTSSEVAGEAADGAAAAPVVTTDAQPLPFTAGLAGSYSDVQKALTDLSKVIRPINLTEMTITSDEGENLLVDITGNTYYLPARTIDLQKEVIKQ